MNEPADGDLLLDVLGQVNNAVRWYQRRIDTLTAAAALADALDDWIVEQGEQPDRGDIPVPHGDRLLDVLESFQHTVRRLGANGRRPNLTATTALAEALSTWAATASVEHNRSEPFRSSGRDPKALADALPENRNAERDS